MKRFILMGLMAALAMCVFPLAASAQVRAGSVHVSPMAGGIFPSDSTKMDNGGIYGLGIGYNITENWGLEAFGAYSPLKTDDVDYFGNDRDVDLSLGRLDALYHFNTGSRFVPYLAAGIGGTHYSIDGANSESDVLINGGIGLKYFLNDTIALRVDARDMYTLDQSDNYVTVMGGLTFQFGGNGPCMDSDGDGVCDEYDACPGTPAGYKVDSRGCPTVKAIRMDIKFDFNKAVVKEQFMPEVAKVADFMKQHPQSGTVVEGHTDSVGSDEYNMKLSQRRANAVRDVLVNRFGIAAGRLQAIGYGESRPEATNETEEGRYQNRRVVATISGAELD